MAQQVAQDHRLLKAVVVGLGILLLLGFGALIFGLATKGGKSAVSMGAEPLQLPKEASIADMALDEGRLVLRVHIADREELLLVDLSNGRVIGRIPVLRSDSNGPDAN